MNNICEKYNLKAETRTYSSAFARRALLGPLALAVIIAVFLSPGVFAQTASLSVGSASGLAGSSVTIPVTFSPGSTGISTLQFDLSFSSYLTCANPSSDVTAGAAASAAGKSVAGSAISGGVRVIVYGLNVSTIGSGTVANIVLGIASGAPTGL